MAFGNATKGYVKKHSGGGGGGGTTNYSELSNKPQINGVTLDGNKTSEDLGITGGGGASMVVYDENLVTDKDTNIYNLGAKLGELGFSNGDVALIHCQPIFLGQYPPTGCRIYYGYDMDNSTFAVSGNDSVGIDCILTANIQYWNRAVLRIKYKGADDKNRSDLSIRIIKAPTNNN